MDTTPNLDLPYLAAAQSQKHVTHNEALRALDAVVQIGVIDRTLTSPPAAPIEGERHIVGSSALGAWGKHDGHVAAFQDGAWEFYVPRAGWLAWVASEAALYVWSGTDWTAASSGSLNPTPLVGINATADTTNRLTVKSPAALFDNVGNGHQVKLNKAAASDTASLLMQTGYAGRAELGLAGDDDFHFKVSADGATWREALVIDHTTGAVSFPHTAVAASQVNADWNATSGVAQILNKPALGTAAAHSASDFDAAGAASAAATASVATAIQRANHTGTQPASTISDFATAAQSAQVQSDWNATSGIAQILNKPSSLSALWTAIAFAAAIPLDSNKWMPRQVISPGLTFTATGTPQAGATAYVRIIADGLTLPTFAGLKEAGSSSGYNNTAGIDNQITFWNDGIDSWYAVSQQVNAAALPLPCFSAAATASATTIAVTLSAALNTSVVPGAAAFTVTASGGAISVASAALSGAVVTLTLSRSIAPSETLTIAYAQPGSNALVDSTSTWAAPAFTAQSVANTISANSVLRFTTRTSTLAESTDAAFGYDYVASATAQYSDSGVTATGLAAGQDGYILASNVYTGVPASVLGLKASSSNGSFSTFLYGIYADSTGNYSLVNNGAGGGAASVNVAVASGDLIRLRRAGASVYAEVSKNAGTSWTTIKTWTGDAGAKLYGGMCGHAGLRLNSVASSSNWA